MSTSTSLSIIYIYIYMYRGLERAHHEPHLLVREQGLELFPGDPVIVHTTIRVVIRAITNILLITIIINIYIYAYLYIYIYIYI